MDGNLTQWDFHRVPEHPKRSSDEEVMTFQSWRSHMTRKPYPASLPYLPERLFQAFSRTHCPPKHLDGNLTQWDFHIVQEHLNRNSDEEAMTFRSWRSHMTKQPYPTSLPYLPECSFPGLSSTHCPPKNLDRNLTQWAFHRVQEHPKRSSDEEVMTFRSWRSHMTR